MNIGAAARTELRYATAGMLTGILCLLMFPAFTVLARPTVQQQSPSRLYDWRWYNKNQWNLAVTNYGTFGNGIGRSGGEWPAGSGDMYIYGAGIWIGCIKRGAGVKDTLVSIGYNPNSGASEMTPGCYDNAPGGYGGRSYERVYITPDFPPNPLDFPEDLRSRIATPVRIVGSPDTAWFYYIPRTAVSTGDAWAVFNDRDPERHTAGRSPRPIGLEVYQSIYSWTLPWNKDIVFFKLDVRNRSDDTLRDLYLAIGADPDVGNAADDRAGLCLAKYVYNRYPNPTDSAYADNLGYVYSEDASPAGFVGFDFLQSPFWKDANGRMREVAPLPGNDSIYPNGCDDNRNGLIDEPSEGRQVGMSAFKIFILANDPKTDGDQYLGMAGWDWTETPPVRAPYDSIDPAPEDKRFLQATGPVTLAPNELTTVTVAVIGARADRSGDPSTWPYYLAVASRAAQQAYDNNWIMPEPPPSPNVTTIPGDGRVTLIWDDLPERAVDRFFPLSRTLLNPFYVEQDFQGYKVYRSRTGQPGDWQLLAQFDRLDGLTFEDTTVVESLRTRAKDVGLSYCYVDSSDLRLGFPYYYAVTAFDINYVGGRIDTTPVRPPDTLSLESGLTGVRAVPRTVPYAYVPPSSDWTRVSGNPRLQLLLEPFAVSPHAVRNDTFRVLFQKPVYDAAKRQPRYRYCVLRNSGDTVVPVTGFSVRLAGRRDTTRMVATVFDSVIVNVRQSGDSAVDTVRAWMPVLQIGLKLIMDSIPYQFYRTVRTGGSYPPDSVVLRNDGPDNKGHWAYRGSNYRIAFKRLGSALSADVHDMDNDLPVPYRYMKSLTAAQWADSADGWCFQTINDAAETIAPGQTRFMYVAGARFQFRPSGNPVIDSIIPAAGDTWYLYTQTLTPAPYCSEFRVVFTAATRADSAGQLNVRVVPNPYLVRNEWERHKDFRKLKFINLPAHCNIYIYNLAGDLVRTIRHDETRPEVGGVPGQYGGDEDWDLLNARQQKPAPGVYIFHVEADDGRAQTGKFVVIF